MIKKAILIFLFLFIYIYIFPLHSQRKLVKIDIVGKSGIKTYYIKFSNEQDMNNFEIYDVLN